MVVHPDDAAARAIADGALIRVWNDRGSFDARARVSDDARPGVLVAPMGWWGTDYLGAGRAAQATTSQRLTALGLKVPDADMRDLLQRIIAVLGDAGDAGGGAGP